VPPGSGAAQPVAGHLEDALVQGDRRVQPRVVEQGHPETIQVDDVYDIIRRRRFSQPTFRAQVPAS